MNSKSTCAEDLRENEIKITCLHRMKEVQIKLIGKEKENNQKRALKEKDRLKISEA